MKTWLPAIVALLAARLALAANFNVGMNNFSFSPASLTIGEGDTVTWNNDSGAPHTSTSGNNCMANGLWDSATISSSGGSFSMTFPSAGKFPYFCAFHCSIGMVGTLTVTNATTPPVSNPPPSVSVTNTFGGPTNTLWDVSQFGLEHLHIDVTKVSRAAGTNETMLDFDDPFTQDGRGRLSGSGLTTVSPAISSNGAVLAADSFQAPFSTSGSVSSLNGLTRVTFQSKVSGTIELEGKARQISAGVNYLITIDARANQVTGRFVQRSSATGLTPVLNSGSFNPGSIPDSLGDGSWTLVLDFGTPAGNKLNGTALVTFGKNSSQAYPFAFTGTLTAATGKSTLNLKGTDIARGSSLQITLDSSNNIIRMVGRISGQTINLK